MGGNCGQIAVADCVGITVIECVSFEFKCGWWIEWSERIQEETEGGIIIDMGGRISFAS